LRNFIEDNKISIAIAPADGVAGTADINGAIIDMNGYDGVIAVVTFGTITSSAVTSIKMQQDTAAAMGSAARNIYSSMALSQLSGYAKGLLVIPAGYLKLVTLAINTPEYGVAADLGTHVRMVMRNPAFGFNVDVIANLKTCAKEGVRETFTFRVFWDIFAMPQCDTGDPRLEDTNGLRLYNITCSEDTICDVGVEGYVETAGLVDSPVCDEIDIETCTPACSVQLVRGTETATTVTYFAIATVSHGANPAESVIVWEVDSVVQVGEVTAILMLLKADLTDGDLIEVSVTDNLGCVASASITYTA